MKLKNDEKPKRDEGEYETLWTLGDDGELLQEIPVEDEQPTLDLTPIADEVNRQLPPMSSMAFIGIGAVLAGAVAGIITRPGGAEQVQQMIELLVSPAQLLCGMGVATAVSTIVLTFFRGKG